MYYKNQKKNLYLEWVVGHFKVEMWYDVLGGKAVGEDNWNQKVHNSEEGNEN